jgi:LmbE family N-acetylglucosaminyl deacetylase
MFISEGLKVLAIGAHPDDIELGAGGLIHRLMLERQAEVSILVFTSGLQKWPDRELYQLPSRVEEAKLSACELGVPTERVEVLNYADCNLHMHVHDLIREVEQRLYDKELRPRYDLILTHAKGDTHRDHAQVCESTISAARDFYGSLLFYQSPSTILNEFRPTFFVELNAETIRKKDQALHWHMSQRQKPFIQYVRTEGMARSWALFHRHLDGLLEAFEVYKSFWH